MVLLALSAMFSAFGVEVLAFSLQYLQKLPEEPDPLRLQGDLLKG